MLSDHDQLYLRKALTFANGYRELGMYDHALAELDRLNEQQMAQREHDQMRLAILMEAERWRTALPYAHKLAGIETSDPANVVNLAYVTRRADSLPEARVILENAARHFPNEAIILYNLGCYACCSNEFDTATRYLKQAFALDPSFVENSESDEDLRPLRNWLQQFRADD